MLQVDRSTLHHDAKDDEGAGNTPLDDFAAGVEEVYFTPRGELHEGDVARVVHRGAAALAWLLASGRPSPIPTAVRRPLAGPAQALETDAGVIAVTLSEHVPGEGGAP